MRIVRFIVTLFLLCVTVAAQQSSQPRSLPAGVYSSGQAAAGEKIYFDTCASCHGAELGGVERAPALTGAAFLESWQGQDLLRLRTRIDAMPPNAPGSLPDTDAVAVMAFLLRSSGMPAGPTPLPADRAQLARITFGPPRAGANSAGAPGSAPVPAPSRSAPQRHQPALVRSNGPRMAAISRAIATRPPTRSRRTTSTGCRSRGG
jgi:mono/diheme cytochrome c family protein